MKKYEISATLAGLFLALLLLLSSCNARLASSHDPLPSWNDGTVKRAIIDFVTAVTAEGAESYVEPENRIATFDNDGTLWAEKPVVQVLFVIDRVKRMVENDPSLKDQQPYKTIFENDMALLAAMDMHELLKLFVTTQTGMSQSEYIAEVQRFFDTARAPSGKRLLDLRYQPQLELLDYLRENGFKIYICSGGSVDFMRVISKDYYGIPAERVIGTEFKYVFDEKANDFRRVPEMRTFNDKAEKPVNIQYHIGKRPILACGNEGGGGDIYMLRFSQVNTRPNLQLIIDHDDADREFYYQEEDGKSLDWAAKNGWQVVSIKNDWKRVYVGE